MPMRTDEGFVIAVRLQVLDGILDRPSGEHGAEGVVLVGDRCAEHGHHRVADELVDGSVVVLHDPLDRRVERPQRGVHVLRVGTVGSLREPHQVAEDHRDQPALLPGDRRER